MRRAIRSTPGCNFALLSISSVVDGACNLTSQLIRVLCEMKLDPTDTRPFTLPDRITAFWSFLGSDRCKRFKSCLDEVSCYVGATPTSTHHGYCTSILSPAPIQRDKSIHA
ncbi:hypothetical protein M758_1G253200 [Ceratodon purpureus]|nr:hypothetical protein M758_1G253200 [Ceratodon purpureus]